VPDATTKSHEVHGGVEEEHEAAQHELKLAREGRGIEHWQEVVLDEARRVGRPATLPAKPVLEGGERADPARKLDPRAPSDRAEMYVSDPRLPQDEQTPNDHEQNEGEMDDDGDVGKEAKGHLAKT